MRIKLKRQRLDKSDELAFEYDRMFNAGYVGRNQEEVRRHVDELAKKGIPGPKNVPTLYPVVCNALSASHEIEVYGEKTSGEVEYVLLVSSPEEIYVGLGSDHTDRHLEESDIPRAKQICPNIISDTIWPLNDVIARWGDLVMRSWVFKQGEKILYQEGKLALIMDPAALMDFVRSCIQDPFEKIVIFSGTVGMLTGEFVFGERFAAELVDETANRKLTLSYDVKPLKDKAVE